MQSSIYWLDLAERWRLAIMPRPQAGDTLAGEIAGWQAEGVRVVASLLEADEACELGLEGEAALCATNGIAFVSFPIADRGVPASIRRTEEMARDLSAAMQDDLGVAIHCRAGIGRSSLIAACVLVLNGYDAASAFRAIGKARGLEVPETDAQRTWASAFQTSVCAPATS